MSKNAITQKELILAHLREYGFIEPLTALREYGCYRLGAVIFNLRHEGVNITTEHIQSRSRITGRRVRFAKYILKSEERKSENALAS